MNQRSAMLRAFLLALVGVALGIVIAKFTKATPFALLGLAAVILAFLWFRLRSRR